MSIIIRLQNLPWSANSLDIRRFFFGLSIPEGGVHIVGGEMGDAFIAFGSDEDARLAMEKDGGKIKDMQVKLLLSSRTEMMRVIEQARQQNMVVTQPHIVIPQPPILSLQQPARILTPTSESDRRRGRSPSPHRRSRDRSPARDRRRSPDDRRVSKRDRSRSPSRNSRSFSRDSDRRSDRFRRDDRRYDDSRYDDRRSERDSVQEPKRYPDADHVNSKSQLHATEGFRNITPSYEQVNTMLPGLYPYGNQQIPVKGFQDTYTNAPANLSNLLPQVDPITTRKPEDFQPVRDEKYPLSSAYPHNPSYQRSTFESSTKDGSVSSMEQSKTRRRTRFDSDFPPTSISSHLTPGDTKPPLQNQQEIPFSNARTLPGNYPERSTWSHEASDRTKAWNEKPESLLNQPMSKNEDFLKIVPMDIDESPSDISAEKEVYHDTLGQRGPQVPLMGNVLPRNEDLRRENQNRGLPITVDKNQDRGNIKASAKDREQVPHTEKGRLSLQDRGPLSHGDNRALPHQDRRPVSHGENRTLAAQDRGHISHIENKALSLQDRGPISHGGNSIHSMQDRGPMAHDKSRPVLMQDRRLVSHDENREHSLRDRNPMSHGEIRDHPIQDRNLMTRGETREHPIQDRSAMPHGKNREHLMQSRGPMSHGDNREHSMQGRGPMSHSENRDHSMQGRGPMSRGENREHPMQDRGSILHYENREHSMQGRGPMSRGEIREHPMQDRGPISRGENREHPMQDRGPISRGENREHPIQNRGPRSQSEAREHPMQNRGPISRSENREHQMQDRRPMPCDENREHPMQNTDPLSQDQNREHPIQRREPMSQSENREHLMKHKEPITHGENKVHPTQNREQILHGENKTHSEQDGGQMLHDENKTIAVQDRGTRSHSENRVSPAQNRVPISHNDGQGQTMHSDSPARMPPSLTVELRGLRPDARIDDILDIFRGIPLPAANIRIEANDLGLEKAFIRFVSIGDFEEALRRNRQFINEGRCELVPCPAAAFDSAPRPQKPRPKLKPCEEDLTVQLRGLPFSCKEDDIVNFFDGLGILDLFVEISPDGRASGTGFVEFGNPEDFHAALTMNGKMIGHRYITVSVASKEMLTFARGEDYNPEFSGPQSVPRFSNNNRPPNPPANQGRPMPNHIRLPKPPMNQGRQGTPPIQTRPPPCVSMKGLPEGITNREIVDFLDQMSIMPRAVHIMLRPDKTPSGDAFAEFGCPPDMEAALQLNGKLLRNNRVLIQPISFHEMLDILGRPNPMPPPASPTALLRTPNDVEKPRRPPPGDVERPRRLIPNEMERPRRPLLPQGPGEGMFRERLRMEPPGRPFGPGRMRGPWPNRMFSGGNRPEGRFPPPPAERGLKDFGAPGCVVSINNLHFRAGLEELLDFFQDYRITKDSIRRKYNENGQTTGEARIAFQNPRDAQRAVRELNQKTIMGRSLSLSIL